MSLLSGTRPSKVSHLARCSRFGRAASKHSARALGLLALLLVCSATTAFAEPAGRTTQRHLERGLRKYKAGDYAGAIWEFQAGYEREPWPDFLFALAQARRMSGDCVGALAAYHGYLQTNPSAERVERTMLEIRRCEASLAALELRKPTPTVEAPLPSIAAAPPAEVAQPTPPPSLIAGSSSLRRPSTSPADSPPPRRWYGDALGEAAIVIGAAAAVGGMLFWKSGNDTAVEINGANNWGSFASLSSGRKNAMLEEGFGIGTAAVGGALVVAGTIHWIAYLTHRHPHQLTTVAPLRGGALVRMGSEF